MDAHLGAWTFYQEASLIHNLLNLLNKCLEKWTQIRNRTGGSIFRTASGFRNTGSFKDSLNAREQKIIVDKTKKYEIQMEGAYINFNTAIHSKGLFAKFCLCTVPIFVYIKK